MRKIYEIVGCAHWRHVKSRGGFLALSHGLQRMPIEKIIVLGVSHPYALCYVPHQKRYYAGCRCFTLKQAVGHWGRLAGLVGDNDAWMEESGRIARAKTWMRLIKKNEASLEVEQRRRRTAATLKRKRTIAAKRRAARK